MFSTSSKQTLLSFRHFIQPFKLLFDFNIYFLVIRLKSKFSKIYFPDNIDNLYFSIIVQESMIYSDCHIKVMNGPLIKMELLNEDEIRIIINKCGYEDINNLKWMINNYSDELLGYLGEHLSLTVTFEFECEFRNIKCFIKCLPRFDKWKAEFLRNTTFFDKEIAMLGELFEKFPEYTGSRKWRPKTLFVKNGIFVFEDVTELGYKMPCQINLLKEDELMATIAALARFHSQSYLFEEFKSKTLGRLYRIWEDYSEYLIDPENSQPWRDTGMRAVIDFLKEFSRYKTIDNFSSLVDNVIPELYNRAVNQMKPSSKYRNVVVHRDIWTNNIFLKVQNNGPIHALIVDFQTVIYSAPMLDMTSLIYFNTSSAFRDNNTEKVIDVYFDVLSREMSKEKVDINSIIDKAAIIECYNESILFGLTQSALIVPIITLSDETRKNTFGSPVKSFKFNNVSRSQEIIDLARVDEKYRVRLRNLFDELLEKFVF